MSMTWCGLSTEELLDKLETCPTGLTDEVARARPEQYGCNEIEFSKTPAWWCWRAA
jgi:hypothetical protein